MPTPGHAVKARIIGAGLKCVDLAREAGISKTNLTYYISGQTRVPGTQFDIWSAFRRLTGSAITIDQFWGSLYSRRAS